MRLAVFGGGAREGEAAAYLARQGHTVGTWRCELPGHAAGLAASDAATALGGAEAVLLPALGPDAATVDELAAMRPQVPLLTGRLPASPIAGLRWIAYGEAPDFQIANAVPTAEAAIAIATRLARRTAHGAVALVLGYGYCGSALARRLLAYGAQVRVVARRAASREQARTDGCRADTVAALPEAAAGADLVWNTIPAPVLGAAALARLAPLAVVVDVASAPGGTDFAAAETLGIEALLAPGLPGRHYPRTAGEIVARVALRILAELGG